MNSFPASSSGVPTNRWHNLNEWFAAWCLNLISFRSFMLYCVIFFIVHKDFDSFTEYFLLADWNLWLAWVLSTKSRPSKTPFRYFLETITLARFSRAWLLQCAVSARCGQIVSNHTTIGSPCIWSLVSGSCIYCWLPVLSLFRRLFPARGWVGTSRVSPVPGLWPSHNIFSDINFSDAAFRKLLEFSNFDNMHEF